MMSETGIWQPSDAKVRKADTLALCGVAGSGKRCVDDVNDPVECEDVSASDSRVPDAETITGSVHPDHSPISIPHVQTRIPQLAQDQAP